MHNMISIFNKRLIFYFATIVILSFSLLAGNTILFAAENEADTSSQYQYYFDDDADFLTEQQENSLKELLVQITEYCNVSFATSTDHSYYSTEQFAVSTYETIFGNGTNGVSFVIDRDLNQIYLISEGGIQKTISNGRCNSITDNTYVYATSDYNYDYYTCAYKTFEQIYILLQGGRIVQPMKYICNALLALVLAMLINYFIVKSFAHAKKPSTRQLMDGIYTKINVFHPSAQFTHQTKRYDPPSSSSGGSSGGGGGGGGHSGGGHSI